MSIAHDLGADSAANYSVSTLLRDGRPITIRALRPDDRAEFIAAVERSSPASRYRRFLRAKRHFSEKEIAYFLDIDFTKHVALVATMENGSQSTIIGGGRYVVTEPGVAEVAFMVVDQFQNQGIGSVLLQHLIALARKTGLKELTAEVLPDNASMLKVFEHSGLPMKTESNPYEVHVVLQLS